MTEDPDVASCLWAPQAFGQRGLAPHGQRLAPACGTSQLPEAGDLGPVLMCASIIKPVDPEPPAPVITGQPWQGGVAFIPDLFTLCDNDNPGKRGQPAGAWARGRSCLGDGGGRRQGWEVCVPGERSGPTVRVLWAKGPSGGVGE